MKLRAVWWLAGAGTAFLASSVTAQVSVSNLLVENKPAPLGIDVSPRFSWLLESSQRNVTQKSYRIKVSTVSAGASDVWDSGVVDSPNPYLAPYGGPALAADTTYFWSVSVSTPSADGASASSNFTTGLLTSNDWGSSLWIGKNVSVVPAALLTAFTSAEWIWSTESGQTVPNAPPGQVALRLTYTPPTGKVPASATVVVTADDQFTLYADGILVGSAPNATDVWKQAQIFNDVTLASGSSSSSTVFAVLATNLPDVATGGAGPAGVLFAAQISFTDGSTAVLSSSSSWKAINAPIPADFQSPSFDDSSWPMVQALGAYGVSPWDTSVTVSPPTPTKPSFTSATWVWNAAAASPPAGDVAFRKTISANAASATASPVSASLVITVDDFFSLYLNGALVGSSPNVTSEWQEGFEFDNLPLNSNGPNVFAVLATNNPDATSGAPTPAGLIFSANVLYSDGSTSSVISDTSWKATSPGSSIPSDFADPGLDDSGSGWVQAVGEGAYGVQPWGTQVGVADPLGEHPAPLMRKEFSVSKEVGYARLYYAVGGYAHITLNGVPVSDHVLSPGFTKYDTRMQYVSLDVKHLLSSSSSANAIAAELGRSHYGVTQGSVWNWNGAPWHGEPVLRLVLSLGYTDGTTERVVSDGSWKNIEGPTRLDDVFGGENYNASYEIPGWDLPGFDDSTWNTALVATAPKGVLVSARNPPTRVVESLTPVSITQPVPGQYVAAFERVVAGWVRLTAQGPKDTLITVHYGEKLNPDGTVIWEDLQHYYQNNWQTDRFWLAGTGAAELFEPKFSYKGYQYITIFGWPGPADPTPADIIGQVAHDDLDKYGDFTSSSDLLNQLHVAAVYTLLNNLHSIPTDCPTFEKNGWTGDAQLSAESFLTNLDAADLLAKYSQDTTDSLAGGPPAVIIPDSGWGANNQADPWHAALVLIPAFIYSYRGDTRVLSDNYAGMKAYVEFELGRSPGNIATTGLGDWDTPETSPLGGNPPEDPRVPATAYLYHMFDTMATVATVLDKTADASSFASQAVAIKNSFNAAFLNPTTGYYTGVGDSGYRQSHNLLSLGFNLTPNTTTAQVVADSIVSDVQARGGHLNTGALSSKQLLPMLTAFGHGDTALGLAEQTTYPSWGYWIVNGATSMWEHWLLTARSHDHHFLGTFEDWFYKYVLGIQATSTAFQTVNIAPAFLNSNLTSASGWMRTPFGNLTVSWSNRSDMLSLHVGVPVGVIASVSFAVGVQLEESGKPITQAPGVAMLPVAEGSPVRVSVGSGQYSFVAK